MPVAVAMTVTMTMIMAMTRDCTMGFFLRIRMLVIVMLSPLI